MKVTSAGMSVCVYTPVLAEVGKNYGYDDGGGDNSECVPCVHGVKTPPHIMTYEMRLLRYLRTNTCKRPGLLCLQS